MYITQKRKKKSKKLTRIQLLRRARIKKYEQCRDTKCTPEWIMDKELKNYSKTVKSKCGRLPKNINAVSDKEMRAHAKCTSKLYAVSRYNDLSKEQMQCVKKNCNYDEVFSF